MIRKTNRELATMSKEEVIDYYRDEICHLEDKEPDWMLKALEADIAKARPEKENKCSGEQGR